MAIWVIKDGQREGPYEEQDVRELVYEGTYTDSEPAIRDGQYDWTTLGQVLGRQPPPAQPAPAAPAEPALPPAIPPEPPPAAAEAPAEPPAEPPPIPATTDPVPPELPEAAAPAPPIQVAVVDFQMPVGSMVMLMVKWVLAAIPALLILGAIAAIFWTAFFALVAAVLGR
jgi:GYF domain 2